MTMKIIEDADTAQKNINVDLPSYGTSKCIVHNTFARSALECFNQKKIYKVIIQKNIPTLFCVKHVASRLIGVRH